MKKISCLAIMTVLTLPVFAEEVVAPVEETPVVEQNESAVVEEVAKQFEQPKLNVSNPKTHFPHGLQLGLGVSPTSGLNAFVGYNNKNFDSFWWKRFGVRLDLATYSPIKNKLNKEINEAIGDEGIKIDDNLRVNNAYINAKHFGALVDFYPFGNTWFLGGWRLSGGYMTGNIDLSADIKGTQKIGAIEFELGGRKYSYDGSEMRGKANVNWKYSGPYLGTGFDLGLFWGVKIYMDAGVVFAGNHATADLNVPLDSLKDITVPGVAIDVSENSPVPEVQEAYRQYKNAKAKALADAQKEMDKVDYYPIVKLGFMYRF